MNNNEVDTVAGNKTYHGQVVSLPTRSKQQLVLHMCRDQTQHGEEDSPTDSEPCAVCECLPVLSSRKCSSNLESLVSVEIMKINSINNQGNRGDMV